MKDGNGLRVDGLRIAVTQQCNRTCPYCHREGEADPGDEMSLEKIRAIISAASTMGFTNVKITGGEPLLRKDIVEIISIIKQAGINDISMTTNGILLKELAQDLVDAGLDRINIGCDSLTSSMMLKNSDEIDEGLKAAKEAGLQPIKLNMVVLRGLNENEVWEMIGYASAKRVILQLIELINLDKDYFDKHYYSLEEIEKKLREKSISIKSRGMHNRMQYDLGEVIVEVVRPTTDGFCKGCRRLRITSDGMLKQCLMKNTGMIEFKDRDSIIKALNRRVENG